MQAGKQSRMPIKQEHKQMKGHMKKTIRLTFAGCMLSLSCLAEQFQVGVSPYGNDAENDALFRGTMLFVLEGMAPGDRMVIYDAFNLTKVSEMEIPQKTLYEKNSRARVERLKPNIAAFKRVFGNSISKSANIGRFFSILDFDLNRSRGSFGAEIGPRGALVEPVRTGEREPLAGPPSQPANS